ncbi:hypothetical protein GH714_042172 [Hevea brasiliensis]|uniref:Pectinesterase inhibitor domain-containing protein n=1 Tax=Hevea brasiliensis TaxID=3981 RepID=A0A6A6MSP0_HEVBR|nr:hypothetical protein GH714_042172 [Hevea brasiliensis]
MTAYVSNLSRQSDYGSDHRAAAALHDCFSNFGDAVDEIRGSLKQMRQLGAAGSSAEALRFQMSNVQTWMSAALTDEENVYGRIQIRSVKYVSECDAYAVDFALAVWCGSGS